MVDGSHRSRTLTHGSRNSVSYTHLDVYKRQGFGFGAIRPPIPHLLITPGAGITHDGRCSFRYRGRFVAEVQTWRASSIQRFHQVELVVSSVSSPGDGGSIYVGARSAATLGVVTTRSASMRRCMRARQVTRSSAALSRARRGFGTIAPTSTSKDLAWHHRCTIRSTNLYQDPPAVFRPTGRTFWWNRDDALGRDRLGVSCIPVSYTHLDVYKRQVEYGG